MELNVLTQIQEKISTNRQRRRRTLLKLKSGNSSEKRVLNSLNSDTSSNSGQNRLIVTSLKRNDKTGETPEQILNRLFSESGWVVRSHFNDPKFRVENLENRTVAFTFRNENDELQKYSGTLQSFSKAGSALFKLAGVDQIFNVNLVGFMATTPA